MGLVEHCMIGAFVPYFLRCSDHDFRIMVVVVIGLFFVLHALVLLRTLK